MSNKILIHYGYYQISEINLIKKFANDYNLVYTHEPMRKVIMQNPKFPNLGYNIFIQKAKYANFVIIWNGMQCYGPLITNVCIKKQIPRCYIEWGMLPQSKFFFIDPMGFCANSILNYDLSWINEQDMNNLYQKRNELQKQYLIEDHGYILIPLQIDNDSQILYFTKYLNMCEFINDIIKLYPNKQIIIKDHPKSKKIKSFQAWSDNCKKIISINDNIKIIRNNLDFMTLASKASEIIGLTSTTLYEAGILGKKVTAIGEHPLNNKSGDNIEKILAGALALNIDRETGDLKTILDRFNIKPK